MKKFLFIILVLTAMSASAQSIKLFCEGQEVHNLDTLEVLNAGVKAGNPTYVSYANVGNDDIYVKVSKNVLQLTSGSTTTFCVAGTCYPGNNSQEFYISQGDTISDETNMFHAAFNFGSTGVSLVKYKFYNTSVASDSISFVIRYTSISAVPSVKPAETMLRAYPNPATTSVNIEYSAPESHSYLVIKNLTGSTVYKQAVPSGNGKVNVNVSDLTNGIYFYGIESNGNMLSTKKLLIK